MGCLNYDSFNSFVRTMIYLIFMNRDIVQMIVFIENFMKTQKRPDNRQ